MLAVVVVLAVVCCEILSNEDCLTLSFKCLDAAGHRENSPLVYSELGPFKNALLFKRKASERGAKRECRRRDSGLGQYHGAQIAVPQPNEACLDLKFPQFQAELGRY